MAVRWVTTPRRCIVVRLFFHHVFEHRLSSARSATSFLSRRFSSSRWRSRRASLSWCAILRLPADERLATDAMAADIDPAHAGIAFGENGEDLLFGEATLLHWALPALRQRWRVPVYVLQCLGRRSEHSLKGLVSTRSVVAWAAVLLMPFSSLRAQTPMRHSAREVHARIETDRSTYRVGDSIRVRIVLRNVSNHEVKFSGGMATSLVRLQVTNEEGKQVVPTVQGRPGTIGAISTLGAGSELKLTSFPGSQEWMNLRDWGYQLGTPGRYVILCMPRVGGPALASDTRTKRSNEVTITIAQ